MGKLDGKVALITGAASGMGEASARLWAKEGGKIAIADIQDEKGEKIVSEICAGGGDAFYIHTDVTSVPAVGNMIHTVVEKYGKLDIFWHNAGNAGPGKIEETTEKDFDFTFALHVKAGFFGAKYAIEEMKSTGGGALLFTSSIAGLKPSRSSTVYSLCKSSEVMLTKCLANYYGHYNIRTNCICPGPIQTALLPSFMSRGSDDDPKKIEENYKARVPLGRLGTADEIAKTALWLVSDDASFVNGAVVSVDGGLATL